MKIYVLATLKTCISGSPNHQDGRGPASRYLKISKSSAVSSKNYFSATSNRLMHHSALWTILPIIYMYQKPCLGRLHIGMVAHLQARGLHRQAPRKAGSAALAFCRPLLVPSTGRDDEDVIMNPRYNHATDRR